jgi:transcription initiation factor TFIIIB Brf1 subunit/transcription initiation factor TFIIB
MQSRRCEYCGARLIVHSGSLVLKEKRACPECHKEISDGSRVCLNCGKILTEDEVEIKKLRYFQATERTKQEKWRSVIPDVICGNIRTDEYVHFVLSEKGFLSEPTCWVVTEKKVMKYEKGQLWEIPIDDIASVNVLQPEQSLWLGDVTVGFFLQTYDMKQLAFTKKIPSALDMTIADMIIDTLAFFTKMIETSRFLREKKITGMTALWKLSLH